MLHFHFACRPGGRLFFNGCLVGGFKHVLFSIIYGIILSIDFHICFKMVNTTNQLLFFMF